METPLLLIVYNRPEKVRQLLDALSAIRPAHIYVYADGPRMEVATDRENCVEVRKLIADISWSCQVETNFSDTNIGCKLGVSSAITWFFSRVDEGIILEDDCMPGQSFFPFCTELLERYRENSQIMHIGGFTFLEQGEISRPQDSYHFSEIDHIWGWATWKRAWDKYDIEMRDMDKLDTKKNKFWINLFRHVKNKNIDTWDAQWMYTILINKGLAITPNCNLIQNIGFDDTATHTKHLDIVLPAVHSMQFPLIHPKDMEVDHKADTYLFDKVYKATFKKRLVTLFNLLLQK